MIDENTWVPVITEGAPSMGLAFHTASLLGSQIVVLFFILFIYLFFFEVI